MDSVYDDHNDSSILSGSGEPHLDGMHSPSDSPSLPMIVPPHLTPTHHWLMMAHQPTSKSYHPSINGMFTHRYIVIIAHELSGMPCDTNGNYIDPSTPSPAHFQTDSPNDWTLYGSQLKFKMQNFHFHIIKCWAVKLTIYLISGPLPYSNMIISHLSHPINIYMLPLMQHPLEMCSGKLLASATMVFDLKQSLFLDGHQFQCVVL